MPYTIPQCSALSSKLEHNSKSINIFKEWEVLAECHRFCLYWQKQFRLNVEYVIGPNLNCSLTPYNSDLTWKWWKYNWLTFYIRNNVPSWHRGTDSKFGGLCVCGVQHRNPKAAVSNEVFLCRLALLQQSPLQSVSRCLAMVPVN